MAIRVFQLKLTPTYSIYLLTTYYPQKGLNLLFLQRLDSYLKSLKFQFPSLTDLCSLYSFIFISFFVKFFVSSRYTKNFIIPDYCQCLHFKCLFLYIYCLYRKKQPAFLLHPTQEYIRQIYHHQRPLYISTYKSKLLYNISRETRFYYCQP